MKALIEQVWNDFLKIIKEEVGIRVVETWIKAVSISRYDILEHKLYLSAPNLFVKDWIETHYKQLFVTHLNRLLNIDDLKIIFCVGLCNVENDSTSDLLSKIIPAVAVDKKSAIDKFDKDKQKFQIVKKYSNISNETVSKLNPSYTFDMFVVGENNSFAYASAKAVVQKLGKLYNPLLLYGCSGLGKTHLLHAIGNEIIQGHPELVVLYQSTDKFVSEFINAIRFDQIAKFQLKYKKIDVLLLDDIQFMVNKEQTQEAFFHIFNSLYDSNKQIILSCDTLPRNLGGLVDRLKSRLEWGLVADVQVPMFETKIAILKRKAELQKEFLPDDVLLFIANRSVKSVRELEGSLIRVLAYASLTNQAVTIDLVKKVLVQVEPSVVENSSIVDFNVIIDQIYKHFAYSIMDLRSKDRSKGVSHARQIAMYLMKKYTGKSLREIGEYLDRKDHTTITHAIHRIQELSLQDQQFALQLKNIEQSFK